MDLLNLDKLEDPLLTPILNSFDTFNDLNFNFNNLTEENIGNKINQNTVEYVADTVANTDVNQDFFNTELDALLNEQIDLSNIEIFQSESIIAPNSLHSTRSSDSPLSSTIYEQSAGTPESITESNNSLSPLQSNQNEKTNFDFENKCEQFLTESFDFETRTIDDKMEVVVEKGTCINLDDSFDSDDNSEENELEKFTLTSEEKQVFIKEGYKIPTHVPLTKNEEKLLKLVRRKIRNKKSAHNSRERKKKYINGLEKRVEYCTKLNESLSKENKLLKNQNIQLTSKLKEMQKCMNELFHKHKRTSTAMLFVSFLIMFCVYPTADTEIQEKHVSKYQTIPFKGYSRALLSNDLNMSTMSPNGIDSTTAFEKLYNFYKDRYDL